MVGHGDTRTRGHGVKPSVIRRSQESGDGQKPFSQRSPAVAMHRRQGFGAQEALAGKQRVHHSSIEAKVEGVIQHHH